MFLKLSLLFSEIKKKHFDENAFNLKIGTEHLKRVGDNCKDKYFKFKW